MGSLAGCEDPTLKTGLRPEGDPEVLAVLVGSGFDIFSEVPTFCKENDEKVPVFNPGGIQICPRPDVPEDPPVTTFTSADPLGFQVRVVFDELLDPDIEDLVDVDTGGPCTDDSLSCAGTFARTQPVDLQCNDVAVAYNGWYDPTGNSVTIPPGPSILVFPVESVATSASCTITMRDNIVDKDNNPVPDAQAGPYNFGVAALAIAATDPEEGATVDPSAVIVVSFNAELDPASVSAGEIVVAGPGGANFTMTVEGTDVVFTPDAALPEGAYTLTITAGSMFADIAGGTMTVDAAIVVNFTVAPAA